MNGLSLCSGIGGLDLGLHLAVPGYRTVCYVEIDPYCQDVLLARMADGVLDRAPVWGDLKSFDGRAWRGLVDVVHGGYPCQPFSHAGRRGGASDPRHLWPDVARIVAEIEPSYCFFENVSGHLSLGFRDVARDLESLGYRVSAGLFTAAEVGAPHKRQRLFVLAVAAREQVGASRLTRSRTRAMATDAESGGTRGPGSVQSSWWATTGDSDQSDVLGVVDGLPRRMDRLRALGNAVVPRVAALAWWKLLSEP